MLGSSLERRGARETGAHTYCTPVGLVLKQRVPGALSLPRSSFSSLALSVVIRVSHSKRTMSDSGRYFSIKQVFYKDFALELIRPIYAECALPAARRAADD